jgi:hypothetical protein
MQNSDESLFDVARAMRYPDGFTLSNQMERLLAVRPSFARERLGWEWVVEAWLLRECALGGLGQPLRGMSVPAGGEGPEGHAAAPERPDGAGEGRDSGRPEGQSGAKRNGAAA